MKSVQSTFVNDVILRSYNSLCKFLNATAVFLEHEDSFMCFLITFHLGILNFVRIDTETYAIGVMEPLAVEVWIAFS